MLLQSTASHKIDRIHDEQKNSVHSWRDKRKDSFLHNKQHDGQLPFHEATLSPMAQRSNDAVNIINRHKTPVNTRRVRTTARSITKSSAQSLHHPVIMLDVNVDTYNDVTTLMTNTNHNNTNNFEWGYDLNSQ